VRDAFEGSSRMATSLPTVLQVEDRGDGHFAVPQPDESPEARDVVFSGQLLAQMIMISDKAVDSTKDVKSIHAIFARAGTYSGDPLDFVRDSMHSGRAWGSDTITVTQGDRLLSRGLVLMNTVEPDLMRHGPGMPDVPDPDSLERSGFAFDGVESRAVPWNDATAPDGTPVTYTWLKGETSYTEAANRAILAWCQPGQIIGLGMRPHRDTVNIADAHRSISTGVIAHTSHFHEPVDLADWLLIIQNATYAGRGRVYGRGAVYTRDGTLVATFEQDAMARGVEGPLDPKRAM